MTSIYVHMNLKHLTRHCSLTGNDYLTDNYSRPEQLESDILLESAAAEKVLIDEASERLFDIWHQNPCWQQERSFSPTCEEEITFEDMKGHSIIKSTCEFSKPTYEKEFLYDTESSSSCSDDDFEEKLSFTEHLDKNKRKYNRNKRRKQRVMRKTEQMMHAKALDVSTSLVKEKYNKNFEPVVATASSVDEKKKKSFISVFGRKHGKQQNILSPRNSLREPKSNSSRIPTDASCSQTECSSTPTDSSLRGIVDKYMSIKRAPGICARRTNQTSMPASSCRRSFICYYYSHSKSNLSTNCAVNRGCIAI